MINLSTSSNFIDCLKTYGMPTQQTEAQTTYFFVLRNISDLEAGRISCIHLSQPVILTTADLQSCSLQAHHIAKVVLCNEKPIGLKVHEKIAALNFNELAFDLDMKEAGQSLKINKEEITVEVATEEDLAEFNLFLSALVARETNEERNENTKEIQGTTRTQMTLGQIAKGLNAQAISSALNKQRESKERALRELKQNEQAMIERDARKRAEQKREERWKQKQIFFLIKDEMRWNRQKEDLKRTIAAA